MDAHVHPQVGARRGSLAAHDAFVGPPAVVDDLDVLSQVAFVAEALAALLALERPLLRVGAHVRRQRVAAREALAAHAARVELVPRVRGAVPTQQPARREAALAHRALERLGLVAALEGRRRHAAAAGARPADDVGRAPMRPQVGGLAQLLEGALVAHERREGRRWPAGRAGTRRTVPAVPAVAVAAADAAGHAVLGRVEDALGGVWCTR